MAPSVSSSCTRLSASPFDTVSFANLLLAHVGGAAALFLATTDATLIATALPTIASDLRVSSTDFSWISVTYLLCQTVLQPVFGHVADTLGRKTILIASVILFMVGSVVTALAQRLDVLILGRAISGAAAGGIVSSVWTILAEVVPPSKRAVWSTSLSFTWCTSAIAGPVLGGAFTGVGGHFLSWRIAFWINVPICLVALGLVLFALRNFHFQQRCHQASWVAAYRKMRDSFDFLGLVLLMGATSCLLLGFSRSSSSGWNDRMTLALIGVGAPLLIVALVYEAHTSRDALIPPSLFRSTTACIVFLSSFFITFAFNAGTFYLAIYAQARGATPLEAGYFLLPFSLGSSAISIPTAIAIHLVQRGTSKTTTRPPKIAFALGLGLAAVGFGLLIRLDISSNAFERVVFPLIAGLGIGMTFHSPYQILANAVEPERLASATGAFFLVRFIATTVGVSTAGVIFTSQLAIRLPSGFSVDTVLINLGDLISIPDPVLRRQVLHATSKALSMIWTVCCPMVAVACLAALCIRVSVVESPHQPDSNNETPTTPARASSPSESSTTGSDDTIIDTPDLEKDLEKCVAPFTAGDADLKEHVEIGLTLRSPSPPPPAAAK